MHLLKKKILGCFHQHPGGRVMSLHSSWARRGPRRGRSGSGRVLSQAAEACAWTSLGLAPTSQGMSRQPVVLGCPLSRLPGLCISISVVRRLHHRRGAPVHPSAPTLPFALRDLQGSPQDASAPRDTEVGGSRGHWIALKGKRKTFLPSPFPLYSKEVVQPRALRGRVVAGQ